MAKGKTKKNISGMKKKEMIAGYLFLVPAAVCLFVWVVYPIINSFWYSLTDFDILNSPSFIGVENYKKLLTDDDWIYSLKRTFQYVIIFVPLMYCVSLGAAELIKHLKHFAGFFKTAYFLPIVVSATAAGAIFKLVMNTKMGVVNKIIFALGFKQINFLGDKANALGTCITLAVWLGFGYNMLIFLAAMLDIPSDYYEAAKLDGASGLQLFRYITFPALGRTSVFVLTMSVIDSFQTYDIIKLLTDGGPDYATTLAIQRIYMNAFQHYKMGYACAMTVMLFAIIFVITLVQMKLTSKMAEKGWG